MRRPVVVMVAALVLVLVSCSDEEQASSTTQDQTAVAVEDETTTMTSIDDMDAFTTDPPVESTATSTGTVIVTVTGIEEAIGFDLAGVVRKIDRIGDATYESGVGGFGVVVDTDPFATTQVVRAPDVWGHNPYIDVPSWPWVADEPAILKPGTYSIQLLARTASTVLPQPTMGAGRQPVTLGLPDRFHREGR